MTPIQMGAAVLAAVGESEAIFHTAANVKPFVQHAEQLAGMARALTEKTLTLPLVYNQALYLIHAAAADYIYPLRVSIARKQLQPTTLSRITDRNPEWQNTAGVPEFYFMVGCTHLGFFPTPPSNTVTANVTYIAQPPVPSDIGSYLTSPEWHEAYVHYATAILLSKEHQYESATAELQAFLQAVGMPRDVRFGPEVRGDAADYPLHPSVEIHTG